MTDIEFLSYCESHSETERAGFTPRQLFRLFQLAGDPGGGGWDQAPEGHIESFSGCPWYITDRVKQARLLLKEAGK